MRRAVGDLLAIAAQLVRVLGREHCLIIGGLAVAGHGYVRATDDVDVIVNYSLEEARRRLRAAGIEAALIRGDLLEGDSPCMKGTLEGIAFDVLAPLVSLDWEKAVEVSTASGRLRVVDLEGLMRLKLRAQGIQDVLDTAILVLRHPEYRDVAREIAEGFRVLDRLDAFLGDRRTQATANEQGRRERAGPERREAVKRKARRSSR